MIKTILFDLDGVLVDACDWHYHSLNDALLHYVGFTISQEEHRDKFNGLPTSVKSVSYTHLTLPTKRIV